MQCVGKGWVFHNHEILVHPSSPHTQAYWITLFFTSLTLHYPILPTLHENSSSSTRKNSEKKPFDWAVCMPPRTVALTIKGILCTLFYDVNSGRKKNVCIFAPGILVAVMLILMIVGGSWQRYTPTWQIFSFSVVVVKATALLYITNILSSSTI